MRSEVEHLEKPERPLVYLALPPSRRGPAERRAEETLAGMPCPREQHVVEDRHRRQHLRDLERAHHPSSCDRVRRLPLDRLASVGDGASVATAGPRYATRPPSAR